MSPTVMPSAANTPAPRVGPEADLEHELQLIRDAHRELRRGRSQRALALLAQHEQRFPQGSLREARQIARITAYKRLGQASKAKREAEVFLKDNPNSPSAGRVRSLISDVSGDSDGP